MECYFCGEQDATVRLAWFDDDIDYSWFNEYICRTCAMAVGAGLEGLLSPQALNSLYG